MRSWTKFAIGFAAMLLAFVLQLQQANASGDRPTWRPPPTMGMQDNVVSLKRVGDWQVTCYRRTFVQPVRDACELRLHEREQATGHTKPTFIFDLVIEAVPAAPNPGRGQNLVSEIYDFNLLLDSTPTPSWSDAVLRIGEFELRVSDVCVIGPCLLRRGAAEHLVEQMLSAERPAGVLTFRDAPLSKSFMKRRIGIPLADFGEAMSLLIEQTQLHSGY
ncbi:MAG: hypothetical protein KI792_02830 [Alphaproteobacteria bacterium]|nr:hypothetical protein [Alphaproteobacteria bacterium SS10]